MNEKNVIIHKNWHIPLLAILALGVLVRVPNLNRSIWFDEMLTSTSVLLKNFSALWKVVLFDEAAPFYRIFMFFWIKFFGDSEISIRMPSFLLGISSVFLAYKIAFKLSGRKIALLAAFLLSISPVHIWYSQEATPYSMLLFLSLLSVFSYYKLREAKSSGQTWYPVYFLSIFLAIFTHYCAFVYLMIFSAVGLFEKNKTKRKNLLIINLVISVFFILFLLLKTKFGYFSAYVSYFRNFTFFELWMLFFNWFLFGNSLWNINPSEANFGVILQSPAMLFLQVLFLIIFVHGLMLDLRNPKKTYRFHTIFYLFSLPLFFLGLSFVGLKNSYIERGAFMALPFFYMILAGGATRFKIRFIRITCVSFVLIFSVFAFVGYVNKNEEWTVYKPNPDWRGAAKYLDSEIKSNKKPLLVYAVTPASVLIYYDLWFEDTVQAGPEMQHRQRNRLKQRTTPRLYLYYYGGGNTDHIYRMQSQRNEKTFYVIKNIHWLGNSEEMLKDIKNDPRFRSQGVRHFKGLEVYKFEVI